MVKEELFKGKFVNYFLCKFNVFLVNWKNLGFLVIKKLVMMLKKIDLLMIIFFLGLCYFFKLKGGVVMIVKMVGVLFVLVVY